MRFPTSFLVTILSALFVSGAESARNSQSKPSNSTFTYKQLWNLEKTFWDAFLYPANKIQIQGNASTIFASDVRPESDE
jgi:hypothetical protein